MSRNVRKITPDYLLKIILEEKEKYEKDVKDAAKKTREVEADEYADTLANEIDHFAALKIKEVKAKIELKKIQKQLSEAKKKITRKS